MTTEITVMPRPPYPIDTQWYDTLVSDLNEIVDEVVESRFNYAWDLVNCYHRIGTRILQENDNFERSQIYGNKIAQRVAESIGRSERTVDYAIQFAKMFPNLNLLPEGKDIHWRHIINKYLTTGEKKSTYPLIKKTDLYRMIKEIKELLQKQYMEIHQMLVSQDSSEEDKNSSELFCNYIHYLQDQVNKITEGLDGKP